MIIDDDSFSLGMPTALEMLEQHALLLEGENEQLQHDLSRARKNIEKLVTINQVQAAKVTWLNARVERLSWELSDALIECAALKNRQLGGLSSTWGSMPQVADGSEPDSGQP